MPSLITRIRFANIAIVALVLAVIGAAVWLDRQRALDSAYRDVANLADALTVQIRNDFKVVDGALRRIAGAVDIDRIGDPAYAGHLSETMSIAGESIPGSFGFYIIGVDGYLRSFDGQSPPVDFSNRTIFTALRDNRDLDLLINPPVKGSEGLFRDQWVFNVGRRIVRRDGSFAGVALAVMSGERLQENLAPLDVGKQGIIALFRSDGFYILRHPVQEGFLGRSLASGQLFQERLKQAPSGIYENVGPTENVPRISAYRTMSDLPLVTVVGVSKSEVLADWRDRAIFAAAFALLLSGMVIGFSQFLKGAVRREQTQDRERLATLRAIADTSIELMAMDDTGILLNRAMERARAVVPSHRAVASLISDGDRKSDIRAMSDQYQERRDPAAVATENAIGDLVRKDRRPVRLTRSQLARHGNGKTFAGESQLTIRGVLAAPLIRHSGDYIGHIQLADRQTGEYTAEDEAILVQLASMLSVCIEKADLLDRSRAAVAAAEEARAEVETVLSSISDGLYVLDNDFRFTYLNDRAAELLKRSREDLFGCSIWDAFPETVGTDLYEAYHRAKATGENTTLQFFSPSAKSWFDVRTFPYDQGISVYFRDITGQMETEEKLQQAQKLKAIGQLTGGIAHDFNNLLTVILGNSDLLAEHLHDNVALLPFAEMTRSAAERGAELTQRLLAFARRQPLDPKVVDINKLICGFEGLLRRTLGEQIGIELVQGAGLWRANIDAPQLESALLNLAINARDAMPSGGRLTVETMNAYIDDDYAALHEEVQTGQYVLIAVSDTGSGIPKDVMTRVFEPFFTTKDVGKGSGLGLSMIYGFVKQSGGHVKIYSELGEGTVVKLYLPRAPEDAQSDALGRAEPLEPPRGREVVLLVEDDDMVRSHVKTQLQDLGYSVIEANGGQDAIAAFARAPRIDLLFTDIVMPGGVNGRKLADQLRETAPDLKVLFMSGYTENAIVHHGRLDAGVFLLNKPFRKQDLARKIRQVFETARR
jgi:PAS domain S-box-containing protein